jgi:hypothetical protein
LVLVVVAGQEEEHPQLDLTPQMVVAVQMEVPQVVVEEAIVTDTSVVGHLSGHLVSMALVVQTQPMAEHLLVEQVLDNQETQTLAEARVEEQAQQVVTVTVLEE